MLVRCETETAVCTPLVLVTKISFFSVVVIREFMLNKEVELVAAVSVVVVFVVEEFEVLSSVVVVVLSVVAVPVISAKTIPVHS